MIFGKMKNMSRILGALRPRRKKKGGCWGELEGKFRRAHLVMHSIVACLGDAESGRFAAPVKQCRSLTRPRPDTWVLSHVTGAATCSRTSRKPYRVEGCPLLAECVSSGLAGELWGSRFFSSIKSGTELGDCANTCFQKQ